MEIHGIMQIQTAIRSPVRRFDRARINPGSDDLGQRPNLVAAPGRTLFWAILRNILTIWPSNCRTPEHTETWDAIRLQDPGCLPWTWPCIRMSGTPSVIRSGFEWKPLMSRTMPTSRSLPDWRCSTAVFEEWGVRDVSPPHQRRTSGSVGC